MIRFTRDNAWGLGLAATFRSGFVLGFGPLLLEVYWDGQ